jgi:DNA-binding transcriptional MerR regulator
LVKAATIGIDVFTSRSAMELSGVPFGTLELWAKNGLVAPSVLDAKGTGTRRVYSFRDVVALRVAIQLREAGAKNDAFSKVVDYIKGRNDIASSATIPRTTIVWNGRELLVIDGKTPIVDLMNADLGVVLFVRLHEVVASIQRESRALREKHPASRQSENITVKRAARSSRAA